MEWQKNLLDVMSLELGRPWHISGGSGNTLRTGFDFSFANVVALKCYRCRRRALLWRPLISRFESVHREPPR